MTARPILMSAPMIRALLDGKKTQTRRIVKPQPQGRLLGLLERPIRSMAEEPVLRAWFAAGEAENSSQEVTCPYGKPGDLLWVRETWQLHTRATDLAKVVYRASEAASHTEFHELIPVSLTGDMRPKPFQEGWRSSIHMPRWASRLTLEVTGVRVERLQGISEADAMAEGDPQQGLIASENTHRDWYRALWESINGSGSWAANPWVWCITFSVHQQNVDDLIRVYRDAVA